MSIRKLFKLNFYLNFGTISQIIWFSFKGPVNIIPVIFYFNADLQKDVIIKQNKGKSGIYKWTRTNIINNKIYIGSSINLSIRYK